MKKAESSSFGFGKRDQGGDGCGGGGGSAADWGNADWDDDNIQTNNNNNSKKVVSKQVSSTNHRVDIMNDDLLFGGSSLNNEKDFFEMEGKPSYSAFGALGKSRSGMFGNKKNSTTGRAAHTDEPGGDLLDTILDDMEEKKGIETSKKSDKRDGASVGSGSASYTQVQ